jgi:outer membrane protein
MKIRLRPAAAVLLVACIPGLAHAAWEDLETVTLPEDEPATGFLGMVGVGLVSAPEYSGASDRRAGIAPLVALSYDNVYWRFSRAGAWLYDAPGLRLGPALQLRRGRQDVDSDTVDGMDERDRSWEAGLAAQVRLPVGLLSAGYYADVTDTTGGTAAAADLHIPLAAGDAWRVGVSAGFEWLSEGITDHLYGVEADEVTLGRPVYTPGAAANWKLGVSGAMQLGHSWSLLGGVTLTHLGREIHDSPIVDKANGATGFLGGVWRF